VSINGDSGNATVDWNDGDTTHRTMAIGQINKDGLPCKAPEPATTVAPATTLAPATSDAGARGPGATAAATTELVREPSAVSSDDVVVSVDMCPPYNPVPHCGNEQAQAGATVGESCYIPCAQWGSARWCPTTSDTSGDAGTPWGWCSKPEGQARCVGFNNCTGTSTCAVGDAVTANWAGQGGYYGAVIVSINGDSGNATVDWNDGDTTHRTMAIGQINKDGLPCKAPEPATTVAPATTLAPATSDAGARGPGATAAATTELVREPSAVSSDDVVVSVDMCPPYNPVPHCGNEQAQAGATVGESCYIPCAQWGSARWCPTTSDTSGDAGTPWGWCSKPEGQARCVGFNNCTGTSTCAVGDAVTANWAGQGGYYGAVIVSINGDSGNATVDWNDGDTTHRTMAIGQINKDGLPCKAPEPATTVAPATTLAPATSDAGARGPGATAAATTELVREPSAVSSDDVVVSVDMCPPYNPVPHCGNEQAQAGATVGESCYIPCAQWGSARWCPTTSDTSGDAGTPWGWCSKPEGQARCVGFNNCTGTSTCAVGDAVTANWAGQGGYYGAVIVSINGDSGNATVDWNDGDTTHRTMAIGQINKDGLPCKAPEPATTVAPATTLAPANNDAGARGPGAGANNGAAAGGNADSAGGASAGGDPQGSAGANGAQGGQAPATTPA